MRKLPFLIVGVGIILMASAVFGDSVKLAGKGEVNGTVKQILFAVDGKPVMYTGKQAKSVWVSPNENDLFDLADGTQVQGKLVTVTLATGSGEVTYERAAVQLVTMSDPLAKVRVEYGVKRAALNPKDATATVALAEWCKEQGLKAEMGSLARACLQLKPDEKVAARAQALLDGALGEKPAGMTQPGATEPTATEPGATRKDPSELTEEDKQAIKEAAAKNQELKGAYLQKSQDMRDQEVKGIKDANGEKWKTSTDSVTRLQARVKDAETALQKAMLTRYSRDIRSRQLDLADCQDKLAAEMKAREALATTIKAAMAVSGQKMEERNARIALVSDRHIRLLGQGNILTEAQMTPAYEKALSGS